MAGEDGLVTEEEVSIAVKKFMAEGDPTTTTNRTLAKSVVEHFGERLGPLKNSVMNIVRKRTKALAEAPASDVPSGAVENVTVSEKLKVKPESKADDENATEKSEEKAGDGKSEDKAVDESAVEKTEDKAIGENAGSTERKKEDVAASVKPKAEAGAEPDEDDEDDEFNPEDDDEMSEEGATKRARNGRKEDCDSDNDSPPKAQKARRKRGLSKRTASAAATAALSSSEKELKKLMKLCRELGLRFPFAKFKGIDDAKEKVRMMKAYLAEKGVDATEGRMTQSRIREHRKRLDRDKELAGLDSDNILAEGRTKRRRTIVSYADQKDEDEEGEGEGEEGDEEGQSSTKSESDGEEYKAESASDEDDE